MENKNIVIVGASSGIGEGLLKKLSAKNLILAYSRSRGASDDYKNVQHRNLDVTAESLELGDLPDIIDGLVYCPGTINLKPFRRLSEEDFINDFRINVTGAVKVIQQIYPNLRKSEYASIVMFSTVAVRMGMNFHSTVAASKGAVEGLVKSLAAEFAPKIRVNAVAPSLTDTPLAESLLSTDSRRESSTNMHPLKRIGSVEDQVNAAMFLLGSESSWITGQVLHVDGGLSSIKN